jgi:hypothetical protein
LCSSTTCTRATTDQCGVGAGGVVHAAAPTGGWRGGACMDAGGMNCVPGEAGVQEGLGGLALPVDHSRSSGQRC